MAVTYLLVTVLGVAAFDVMADVLAVNMADNVLHLCLSVAFLSVGFALGRRD